MSLRDKMPRTAAFIDNLRDAFGKAEIDAQIRKGMAGLPGHFHARENGHEVGTPMPAGDPAREVSAADMVIIPPKKEAHANRNPAR